MTVKSVGFLKLANPTIPLNFNKVIISFWYRIPAKTAEAAIASWDTAVGGDAGFGMTGVVPFFTFGPQQEDKLREFDGPHNLDYAGCAGDFGFCLNSYHSVFGYTMLNTYSSHFTNPSFIGVKFWRPEDNIPGPSFSLTVQTDQYGIQSPDEYFILTDIIIPPCDSRCLQVEEVLADISFTKAEHHAAFGNGTWDGARNNGFVVSNPTDHWHHALISWDVGTENSGNEDDPLFTIVSDGILYITHDRVTKTGADLPGYVQGSNNWNTIGIVGRGTYTQSIGTIPTSPLCIPGPATILEGNGVSKIGNLEVEMAELQIYTGITQDTSALVDAFVTEDGKPQLDYTIPDKLLGKSPEVRLHGSGKWKAGINMGTSDNFTKVAKIKSYKPDPSLNGPQSPK